MGVIAKPKSWVDNEGVSFTDLNIDFDTLYNEFNGNIDNNNIKAGAAIDPTKIAGTAANLIAAQRMANKTLVNPIMEGWDGWISTADTWVYNSTSSIKITGVDRTALFKNGTRVKCTNTAVTFFAVVINSTLSGADTIINLVPNNDFSLTNSAITNPYYTYEACPPGFPTWFTYTPTQTGLAALTVGVSKFQLIGNICHIDWQQVGGTSNAAAFTLGLPITPTIVLNVGGYDSYICLVQDANTWQNSPGVVGVSATVAAASIGKTVASQTAGVFAGFTATGQKLISTRFAYPIA